MGTDLQRRPATSADQRSSTYLFLASVFAYPTSEQAARARELAADLALVEGVGAEVAALAGALTESSDGRWQREYINVFTLSTSSDCPLFESAFAAADSFGQSAVMADVAGFFRAFGVAPAAQTRPDELTAELEFMSFLCAKEAYAGEHLTPSRVRQARRAQRLFMQDHVLDWAPELASRIAASTPVASIYWLAGTALAVWLAQERTRLRLGGGRAKARSTTTLAPASGARSSTRVVECLEGGM